MRGEMLKKSTVNAGDLFRKREEAQKWENASRPIIHNEPGAF